VTRSPGSKVSAVDADPDVGAGAGSVTGMLAVFDAVRKLILTGELASGAPLSQVKLSQQLRVSRTPLREALRLLEREGLVAATPRRRVLVNPMSAGDCENIYVQRILLEAYAVRQTVGNLTKRELTDLRRRLRTMHERAHQFDFDGWEDEHRCFHDGLYVRVSLGMLEVMRRLSDHAERYRRTYLKLPRTITVAEEEHHGLLDAALAGDAILGSTRLAEHLARTALAVMAQLDPNWSTARINSAVVMAGGSVTEADALHR